MDGSSCAIVSNRRNRRIKIKIAIKNCDMRGLLDSLKFRHSIIFFACHLANRGQFSIPLIIINISSYLIKITMNGNELE